MQITVSIPDEFAAQMFPAGLDAARAALEALVLEAYRERRVSAHQIRLILNIPSRYELDGFLKLHNIDKDLAETGAEIDMAADSVRHHRE